MSEVLDRSYDSVSALMRGEGVSQAVQDRVAELRVIAQTDMDRVDWMLTHEGRNWVYWRIENGEMFNREDIDKARGVKS